MDLAWLSHNIRTSWRYRDSSLDFVKRLVLIYSNNLPPTIKKTEWVIGFSYPDPVGKIRLLLRSNSGSDSFIHGEVFELQYYDLALPFAPKTILDLGANAGFTAVYFSRVYPTAKIACVEPIPENLRILVRNLELNKVDAVVIPAAAHSADGRVLMEVGTLDYGHKVATSVPSVSACEVDALSIPTILRRLGWDRIDLLKVDIEGHEKALFSMDCSWLSRVGSICIECHDEFSVNDLETITKRFDFRRPISLPGIWLVTH